MALHSPIDKRKRVLISVIFSAIGWAGILLTNIPTAVIAIYITPWYAFIRAQEKKNYLSLSFPIIGSLIGVMIAAVYLLPVTEYSSAVKLLHLWDLQDPEGNSGFALVDIFHGRYKYFYVGLLTTLAAGLWLLYQYYKEKKTAFRKNITSPFLLILLLTIILQIPYFMQPLWNILPFFKLIQFSYRWNILIVVASAVYVALYFEKGEINSVKWFIGLSSLLTIVIALGYFGTMDGLHWSFRTAQGHIDAPEYLPASANDNLEIAKNNVKLHQMDDLITLPNDSFHVHIYSVTPESIRFAVDGHQENVRVVLHRMFFPSWRLHSSKGNEILLAADSLGRVNAILPPVNAEYILSLEESQAEKTGEIISLAGLSLLAAALVLTISWRNPKAS